MLSSYVHYMQGSHNIAERKITMTDIKRAVAEGRVREFTCRPVYTIEFKCCYYFFHVCMHNHVVEGDVWLGNSLWCMSYQQNPLS